MQSNVIKRASPNTTCKCTFRYLELKNSIFASSLLDSVRSSDLSCPSLEFKTNNEILKVGVDKKTIDVRRIYEGTVENKLTKMERNFSILHFYHNFINE